MPGHTAKKKIHVRYVMFISSHLPCINLFSFKGDSGGPLQIRNSEVYCMYDVIGVTSFGKPLCGAIRNPAVYSRVSNYIQWIEDIVWP